MARRIIVAKKGNFIYLEMMVLALAVGWGTTTTKHLHPVWGLIIFIAVIWLTSHLFFRYKFFMYLFSIAFSIVWAGIGFGIVFSMDKSTGLASGFIVAGLIFTYMLWFHKDYFRFRSGATVSEVERF